jgi:aminoglycoside/choline kinase family phosphotransferase
MSTILQKWLTESCQLSGCSIQPIQNDASFRRYFRVQHKQNSFVAMDASEEKQSCVPYIAITDVLRTEGLHTPEIIASDVSQGFLLITDFGCDVLLNTLNKSNAASLYTLALDELAKLQHCRVRSNWTLPYFSADFMRQELNGYKEWFLQTHLGVQLSPCMERELTKCFDFLTMSAANQPYVFMHRDYHSANLMVLPDNKMGILDFQDAFMGPVTYDLVSLLRDCYVAWPETFVTQLVLYYREQLELQVSDSEFLRWFDLMGLQRHLKALLTFSRKYHRDGNSHYLQFIPRTVNYIATIGDRYPECDSLCSLMNEAIICVQ